MAIKQKLSISWRSEGRSHDNDITQEGSSALSIEETVEDGETDYKVTADVDQSAMKMLYLESSEDVTLETNDTDSPDDTLDLKAGEPVMWHSDGFASNPFSEDITDLYFTNASGSDAEIVMEVLTDATP